MKVTDKMLFDLIENSLIVAFLLNIAEPLMTAWVRSKCRDANKSIQNVTQTATKDC